MHMSYTKSTQKGLKVFCAIVLATALTPAIASADIAGAIGDTAQSASEQTGASTASATDTQAGASSADTAEYSANAAENATEAAVSSPTDGAGASNAATASTPTASRATTDKTAAAETAAAAQIGVSTAASGPATMHVQGAADVSLTLTTEQTAYANGEYASFKCAYTLDYGKVKAGDTITITVPDVLKNVSVAYSPLHFSACNDLGNGTYQLVFNDSAPTGLSGYFSVNAFATNTTTATKSGTVSVGGKSAVITVTPDNGGTPGVETRAIEKWAPDGTGYTQTTATQGVYEDGATVRFAFEADPRCSAMKNVIVTDTLPDELEFVSGSIVIERTTADRTTTTTLTAAEAAQFIKSQGQNLEFDFGDMDGTYYYRVYYKAKVTAGTNVKLVNTAHINYDNGTVEASTFNLKPANDAGAAVGYKKVDKTSVTDDPADQTVTYTITFTNDNAFAAQEINLTDKLDSNVSYVTAYGSEYFTLTWDATAHAVTITNNKEIPASMTQTVTIVTDFTNVPVGTTVTNTVGGNTVKTHKTASGKLALTAAKTVDGNTPTADQAFSFTLSDSTGILQTKQNAEGTVTFDTIYYGKDDLGKTFTYKIAEAEPPTGYSKDASVYTVTVTPVLDTDGNIAAIPTITKEGTPATGIAFENKSTAPKTFDVSFQKRDATTNDALSGCSLSVTSADGAITYGTWTSDAKIPHTMKLLPGSYLLKELAAPSGYDKAVPVAFTVAADGTVSNAADGVVTMKDSKTAVPVTPTTPTTPTTPETPTTPSASTTPDTPEANETVIEDNATPLASALGAKTADVPMVLFLALSILLCLSAGAFVLASRRVRRSRQE